MKKPNEVDTYTVAIANLNPYLFKDSMKAVEIIKTLDGLFGITAAWPYGTLVHFKSLNDAKRAKNILEQKGIHTGDNISHYYTDKDCNYTVPSDELEAQA